MRAGPRRCKHDANHADVAAGAYGRDVLDLAAYGCPVDMAIHVVGPLWMLADAKSEHGTLTPWQQEHAGQYAVARDAQELADAIGAALRWVRPTRGG